MKRKGIIAGICIATIILTAFSVPIGNKSDLLQWDPLSLNVLAEGVKSPFQLESEQARFATISQNSATVTVTDTKDLNALINEINALDAQPLTDEINTEKKSNWEFELTISMPEGEYMYYIKDFSVPSSGGTSDTIFNVSEAQQPASGKQYVSLRSANVLKGIVDGLCKSNVEYPYFIPDKNKLFSAILMNNQKRTSVYLDKDSAIPQIAEELSKVKIERKTEDLLLVGNRVYGVDEMRMDVYDGRAIFQFYDNGILLSPLYGPDKDKTIFYLCEKDSLKPLYDITTKTFAYSQIVTPSWLGLANRSSVESVRITYPDGKRVEIKDDVLFSGLKALSIFRSSKAEVKSLPTTWDYRYEIFFKTEVIYTVILQGEYLYIEASDIENEILRYNLMDNENLTWVKQHSKSKSGTN